MAFDEFDDFWAAPASILMTFGTLSAFDDFDDFWALRF